MSPQRKLPKNSPRQTSRGFFSCNIFLENQGLYLDIFCAMIRITNFKGVIMATTTKKLQRSQQLRLSRLKKSLNLPVFTPQV